jgi:cytochrome P450
MTAEALRKQYAVDISLAELEADPYPAFRRLQARQPVAWAENLGMWLVTRYADVTHVLTHPEFYTAETEPSFLADVLGVNMLTLEGQAARRIKRAMQPPFTAAGRASAFVRDELAPIAHELVDSFVADGAVELMARYAEPLSTVSLQRVLGLDHIATPKMWDLCRGVCAGLANFEGDPGLDRVYQAAKAELEDILRERLAVVRRTPDESAIAYFAAPERGLTDEEIINNVRLMISGGINEPRDGIGMVIYACLRHLEPGTPPPADRQAWLRFINEVLRLYSPVGTAARMTTQATELAGVVLPEGEFVAACLAAANRDPQFWEQPECFDPDRAQKDHVAFSLGQHRCLGLWLGLHEILVGASVLLERIPQLRLDPGQPVPISGFEFRGPKTLHLEWR